SLRELPRSKLSERVARDRQIHRWQAEFTEAAVLGAMAVVEGELAPLNPLDPPDQHMYLRENIFFSKGTDSRDMFASLGGGEAAHVVTGKDIEGVRIINRIDPEGIHTLGSVVVDYRGVRVVAQTVVPGIFSSKSEERIVYGSIDNGKTVKSSQEFHELIRDQLVKALHLAEHTVTDSEGTTHSLYTSIESKGIVGADQRRYLLDLYRLNPVDIEFLESVCLETKRGSDEHLSVYPHKMVFLRRELLDIYWDSQFRQAVQAYVAKNQLQQPEEAEETPNQEQQQQQQQEEDEGVEENRLEGEEISRKDQEDDAIGALTREGQKAQEQLDKLKFSLEFNPDAFTTLDVVTAASGDSSNDGEPVTSDLRCKNTRDASRFLRDTVIPAFVHDLRNYLISPIDGESLTRIMHRRGVNIRYLGLIAELLAAPPNGTAEQHSPAGPHIRALVVREMIVRAVKHILRDTFRHTVADLHSEVFAHIINCLLGARYNPDPAIALSSAARSIRKLSQLTPASLATDLREQVLRRYRFRLPDDFVAIFVESNELVLLREISKAVGVQLALRNYRFEKLNEDQLFESVVGGGPLPQQDQKLTKQQRRALREKAKEEASRATSLQAEDVVNFYPLVKEASHVSSFADEASEAGTIALSRGQRDLGLELLLESATMHEQTYGFLHPETGRCYASIAMLYYQANEIEQACMFMHKAIIICERTQGVDSSETVHYYLNLGLL
ncbi:Intracellular distribution of mitochondria, partial [Spiromyces aspiralis]